MNLHTLNMPLPQDIESYIQAGEWAAAERMIRARLQLHLPDMLKSRLETALFFLGRLRGEYPFTGEQLLSALQKQIADFTQQDLDSLRDDGWLDTRMVDGTRMYFEDTVASLLKAHPDIARRAGKPLSPHRPALDEAMARMREKGSIRVRMRLNTTMRITDEAFQAGETYRVHLPLPSPAPQQLEVMVHDIQPTPQHIARESAPQRTAFFERAMQQNQPFTAQTSYLQHLTWVDPLSQSGHRVIYPHAKPPQKEDLEELAPHLVFTPYLKALARELIGDEIVPVRQAKRFYDFITQQVLYSYVRGYLLIENGAEYAAVNQRGDCGLQALLFIALCRIAGIPARWQSGLYALPGDEGSHDWAWFYTETWGWLPADCSFGGAARRGGNEERRQFYFGHLDPYRAIFNHQYMAPFQPPRLHTRLDPYDNQRGEIETAQRTLLGREYRTRHQVEAEWLE